MASFTERRRTIRISINDNLNVESVSAGQSLDLVDVAMGGFSVRSLAPMPLDVVASYRFVTPDGKWTAIFRARAVYCRLETHDSRPVPHYLNGLTFVSVESPRAQQQLGAMIDHATNFVTYS